MKSNLCHHRSRAIAASAAAKELQQVASINLVLPTSPNERLAFEMQ
jgi:hypothetical protein